VVRLFISISRVVKSHHLDIFQITNVVCTIAICALLASLGEPVLKLQRITFPCIIFYISSLLITVNLLFYLVFWYMKDSKLGPQAKIILQSKVAYCLLNVCICLVCAAGICSCTVLYLLEDASDLQFLYISILYILFGVGYLSMAFQVGWAVEITQVSIRSRRRLLS
jgi:hypothetical protein